MRIRRSDAGPSADLPTIPGAMLPPYRQIVKSAFRARDERITAGTPVRAFRGWIEQVIGAEAATPQIPAAPAVTKAAPADNQRWLLSFDAKGEPQLQPAPGLAGITSDEALLQWLADPQGASPALLATMLHVIATRLGEASHG